MPDPSESNLTPVEFGKDRPALLTCAARQQRFPNHLSEKRPRVEMLGRREILKGPRQRLPNGWWPVRLGFRHNGTQVYAYLNPKKTQTERDAQTIT
jgi:hypothetical protein